MCLPQGVWDIQEVLKVSAYDGSKITVSYYSVGMVLCLKMVGCEQDPDMLELQKLKLLVFQPIYVPTFTCGYQLWVKTGKMRLWTLLDEMTLLRWYSLGGRVRSSDNQ